MLHGKKVLMGSIVLLVAAALSTVLIVWLVEDMPTASVTTPKRVK